MDVLHLKSLGCFWGYENCQLKCPFCFTREQKPANDLLSNLSRKNLSEVRIIRFTGGEPLISQDQIDGIVRELNKIDRENPSNLDLIVIQTNAIDVEKRDFEGLKSISLPILFEVSLKGTNIEEYQYLTFEEPISYDKADLIFEKQINGYRHLVKNFENCRNIKVLVRLGIFHSEIKRPMFKFIYPTNRNRLMFDPNSWDLRMNYILQDQKKIWGNTFEGKIVVERIKTGADGPQGIGRRYRRIIDRLKSKNLFIEDPTKSPLPERFIKTCYYKRGNEIYQKSSHEI